MELRHLRYFIAVAEEENVSRAALKLHVSQPALSRQIRDLEDELGFLLLERSAKSVRLTDAGRVFLVEASAVLQRTREAVEKARTVASGGELHIGYAPSLTARFLPATLREFQLIHPRVRVKLHDFSTEEMLTGLRDDRLQLALVVRPTAAMLRGLHFKELFSESLCIAVSPTHPLASRSSVSLSDLTGEPVIAYSYAEYPESHELLDTIFKTSKTRLRITQEHDSVSSLIAAIEAGAGVAFVPESLVCLSGLRLKLLPFKPSRKPFVVGAAWSGNGLSASALAFLECARKIVKSR